MGEVLTGDIVFRLARRKIILRNSAVHIKSGLHVTFHRQSCMSVPDLLNKTLSIDGKLDILHEFNKLAKDGWTGALSTSKTVNKSVHVDKRQSDRSNFTTLAVCSRGRCRSHEFFTKFVE